MDLTSLRYWQWMIVGLFAGAAVGYAWSNLPNDLERTGDKEQFRRLVQRANAIQKLNVPTPMPVTNVVVLEPETDPSGVLTYPVTFDLLQRLQRGGGRRAAPEPAAAAAAAAPQYTPTGIYAPTPFDGDDSVRDFLRKNNVPFTDRTGAARYVPVYYGAGAGLIVIGLLWPAAIRLMLGAGLVAPKPKVEKAPDHRTGEDVDDMLAKPTARPVDAGALGALNDAMEKNLAGSLASGGVRGPSTPAEEPVSVLMSGTGSRSAADPTLEAAPKTEQEKKDFAGQYYPVARTVKKDEEKK